MIDREHPSGRVPDVNMDLHDIARRPLAESGRVALVLFPDRNNGLSGVAARGLFLTILTLGIYRFWYLTDVRRWFWNHTKLNETGFEYTGHGLELFVGFLVALAIVLPLSFVFFYVAAVDPVVGPILSFAGLVVFTILGQFAYFRARRYRLTRTLWRGIRFHQTGSGWAYAGRSFLWLLAVILTFGFAYPWMAASLNRYKLSNTWFGDARLSSDLTGRQLLKPFLIFWLIPIAILVVFAGPSIAEALRALAVIGQFGVPAGTLPQIGALQTLLLSFVAATLIGYLLIPYFAAAQFRIIASSVHLGSSRLRSLLGAGPIYAAYLLYAFLLIIAVLVISISGGFLAITNADTLSPGQNDIFQLIASGNYLSAGILILTYVVIIFAFGYLRITILKFRIWEAQAVSLHLIGSEILDDVAAKAVDKGTGFGEGFGDALDATGFDIGF